MMKETGINNIGKKRIDLIFVQINKHRMNMNFEVFLQTLIKIAEHVYPNVQSQDALVDLVAQYFLPMYQEINND